MNIFPQIFTIIKITSRAMASNGRVANTDDEKALFTAAIRKDVETLTSLLQKGVYPNVYDGTVC